MTRALFAACLAAVLAATFTSGCGEGYSRAEVRYNLGRDLAAEHSYYSAVQEYTEAIRLDPSFVLAYYHRGLVLLALGDYAAADDDLTQTIALDPGLADAYRITTGMVTGNLDRAFSDSYLLAVIRAGPGVTAY